MDKQTLLENAIDWNWDQFFRAVDQDRIKDAKRYRDNIRRLKAEAVELGDVL